MPRFAQLLATAHSPDEPAARSALAALSSGRAPLTLACVGILYPGFYALDLYLYPERWAAFGALRAAHLIVGLGALIVARQFLQPPAVLRVAQAAAVSATLSVTVMCAMTEGFRSLYLGVLIICFFGLRLLELFRPSQLIVVLVALSGLYVALNACFGPVAPRQAALATSFVAAAALVCGASAILAERRHRELFTITASVAESIRELEHVRELHQHFLEKVSQELLPPVLSTLDSVELIQKHEPTLLPKSRANLDRVKEGGRRLLGFFTDLLDLSKAQACRLELHLSTFDLMITMREVAEETRALVLPRDIAVTLRGPNVLLIHSDERRVRQVLTKLTSNAAKFTEAGEITLAVHHHQDVAIEVADTGPGIVPEAQGMIYEAFRRSGVTDGAPGLGLSIVRQLVHLMHGTVELESVAGVGSTFRVRLGSVATDPLRDEVE